jgi:valyl-tRNA synthetase
MQKKDVSEKFLSGYNPSETERRIQKLWQDHDCFRADADSKKPPFSMVLPPPNVTGILHNGHALMIVIQDILARYHRMRGFETLWLPGTDHAAISTQVKVEKLLAKEGKRKHDFSRKEFLERVNTFALESQETIISQIKSMGASLDWSRLSYTLDADKSHAVRVAFKSMYDAGLIYQGDKVINWDPKGQTVVSDEEVFHEKTTSTLYTFRYSDDFPIAIATTRPETKLGDTAIAVHPDDERYKKFIGEILHVEDFCGISLSIKIIADEHVDPEFGTGALGVTPAHSQTDAELAEKHDLDMIKVINEYAKIDLPESTVHGLKTTQAREQIIEWLRERSLIEKEETIEQNLSRSDRTNDVIEPLPKKQWFISVTNEFTLPHSNIEGIDAGETVSLKKLMKHVIENGQISMTPERYEKIYMNWMSKLHDWCISRQIWFGHRIPVWYKEDAIHVGEKPEGDGWTQDEDSLDTWFSSGLWTFSTLGWPHKTKDLEKFHPTTVLETGYDILFPWVARMILMSTFHLGTIPFKDVYFHGLVRDEKGRKMSKSLGNIIDPRDMITKYGADALRMSMIIGNAPGNDMNVSEEKIKAQKHFANKLWNITRFILSYKHKDTVLSDVDKSLLNELHQEKEAVEKEIENFKIHLAAERLYQYTWHRLADEIIEESKSILEENDGVAESRAYVLHLILDELVRALHPFMPHITEEIYAELQQTDKPLAITSWNS